jgi:NlpC/P60 family putative phage cell wall peptidase
MRDIKLQHDIVLNALQCYGTPYHHHAHVLGVGVDCAQLIVAVAHAANIIDNEAVKQVPDYPVQWHLHNREERLLGVLKQFGCVEIEKIDTQPGDIVCFQFGRVTSHLGIMINENEFIHAHYSAGRVVINNMQQDWLRKWTKTYTFPGVLNG